jgi:hypothetical protein
MRTIDARAVLALGLLAAAVPAAAQLHRCTGKDGKVTYTDRECEVGAKSRGVVINNSAGFDSKKGTEAAAPQPPKAAAPIPPATAKPPAGAPSSPDALAKRDPKQIEEDNKRAHEIMLQEQEARRRAAEKAGK